MKKKILGFNKGLLVVLAIVILASMAVVLKPACQNALLADEGDSAVGAAENTTAKVNGLLASADSLMKKAGKWYNSAYSHGTPWDPSIMDMDTANYNLSMALYRQNEAIIELLRQREDK